MDIKSLKEKILQLAIQGKLVPQNENNEPASALLEKIKVEKEQLIKDKIMKKEKSLPEISEDEKRFELPNGWEWIRLGEFIRFVGGNQPPKSTFKYEYQDGYIRLIQIRDYKSDRHITYIPVEKAKRFCNKDEIMIGRYGPPIFQILRGIDGAYNVALMKADPIDGITKDYLFYLLKDHLLLKKLEHLASRTCGQDGIDMDTLRSYVVGLPPLEEQERIVTKVEELFELIDELNNNKQDLLENISNSRNKVLQLAIQGKLVEQCEGDEPASILLERIKSEKDQLIKDKVIKKEKPLPQITNDEKLFDLPQGWEWSRLGDIANIIMGQSPDSSSVSETIGGVEFHQGKASFGKILINNSGLYCTNPTKLAIADDVLLSVRAPVGTLNITDRELCIGRGLTAIRRYIDIDNKFFYYFIMALEEELIKKATGTTFKAVASTAIKEFLIPLPPLKEQKRIISKVDLIMGYLDKLQQEIESQEIILEDILQ